MQDDTPPVVDAEMVPSTPTSDGATVLLELENLIKSHISSIDKNKSELKKLREMVTSCLQNSEAYRDADAKNKETAKEKSKIKQQIMKDPANAQLQQKVQELSNEVKEAEAALSDYLQEFARQAGVSEIETDDGEAREIVYIAKLIKKSSRFM